MSTTTGNNYFTKSMNSIIEIDDGAGTVISDGVIHCNAFSANDLIITNLNSSSITNSGTISSNVINATTINTSTIQTSGTLNLTGSTTNLNGTQADTRTYISNYNNNSVELGTNTNLSYIDFHSSNTANNYDARISSQGVGDLSVLSNSLNVYTNTGITAYSGTLNIEPVIGSGTPSVLNVATINSNNIISTVGNITTLNASNINSNGATITNLTSTTGNITTINSNTINLSNITGNNIVSNFATINTRLIAPLGNIAIVNATDLNMQVLTGIQSTTQNLTIKKDINIPSSNSVSSFFSTDGTINYYELTGTSKLNFNINSVDALKIEENTTTVNNTISSPSGKFNTIQPVSNSSLIDVFTNATNIITVGPTGNKMTMNGGNITLSTANGSLSVGGNIINLTAATANTSGDLNVAGILKMKTVNMTVFKSWTSTFTSTGTLNYQIIIVSLPETVSYSGEGFLLNGYNANYAANPQFFVLGCTPSLANNTPAGSFSRVRLWCYITQPSTVHTVNISCCYIPV